MIIQYVFKSEMKNLNTRNDCINKIITGTHTQYIYTNKFKIKNMQFVISPLWFELEDKLIVDSENDS